MTFFKTYTNNFRFFYTITAHSKPTVAISACLNGKIVRYDGKDKSLSTRSLLSHSLKLLEQCPEVGAGMSTPRPPIELVQSDKKIYALGRNDPSLDVTKALLKEREKSLRFLQKNTLCAYIFKSKSPSCGLHNTPIYNSLGEKIAIGSGIQAAYFLEKMPEILLIDEDQLTTVKQCEKFIFLCLLVFDLQKAIEKDDLYGFNKHYQFMFRHQSEINKSILSLSASNGDTKKFQITFKTMIEKL